MLTGDLSDFSLREILQFLATTSVSGVLQLRSTASNGGIALRDGGICLALLDLQGIGGLAARMLHAGVVDADRLRTVGEQGGTALALAASLAIDAGDADATAELYLEHTHETLGWLARRDGASFVFERSDDLDGWPFPTVTVDAALAEVEDRASDWDDLRDTVSDLRLVASATPDPPNVDEITLTTEQWRLISLVDGRRAVVDLIELSGVGHLRTCRLLDELVTAGLVELVEPGAASTLSTLLDGLEAVGARAGAAAVSVLAAPSPPAAGSPAAIHPVQPIATGPAAAVMPAAAPATAAPAPDVSTSVAVPTAAQAAAAPATPPPAVDVASTGDANRDMLQRLLGGRGAGS